MYLADYKQIFINATKLILKENISKNENTLLRQKTQIVKAYNDIITYITGRYDNAEETDKTRYKNEIATIKTKLVQCLDKFESYYIPPEDIFELIDDSKVDINIAINQNMETADFLKLCSSHLSKIYTGDPLGLSSFLDSIKLLETLATSNDLKSLLATFIRTKIDGKARDYVTSSDLTTKQITDKLRENIRPENEKIIKGKMAALKADRSSLTNFAEQAEILADSLKRAYIAEGIPTATANKMTVEETIAMCKSSSSSDYVKSILASTEFNSPKEVVSKFIIETNNNKADKQVLHYKSWTGQNRNNRFQSNNKYKPNFNQQTRFNQQSRFNQSRQNQHSFNQNRPTQFNSSRNQYQNSNNSPTNSQPNNYRQQNRNRNIRVTNSENSRVPQRTLGEEQQEI